MHSIIIFGYFLLFLNINLKTTPRYAITFRHFEMFVFHINQYTDILYELLQDIKMLMCIYQLILKYLYISIYNIDYK